MIQRNNVGWWRRNCQLMFRKQWYNTKRLTNSSLFLDIRSTLLWLVAHAPIFSHGQLLHVTKNVINFSMQTCKVNMLVKVNYFTALQQLGLVHTSKLLHPYCYRRQVRTWLTFSMSSLQTICLFFETLKFDFYYHIWIQHKIDFKWVHKNLLLIQWFWR